MKYNLRVITYLNWLFDADRAEAQFVGGSVGCREERLHTEHHNNQRTSGEILPNRLAPTHQGFIKLQKIV